MDRRRNKNLGEILFLRSLKIDNFERQKTKDIHLDKINPEELTSKDFSVLKLYRFGRLTKEKFEDYRKSLQDESEEGIENKNSREFVYWLTDRLQFEGLRKAKKEIKKN